MASRPMKCLALLLCFAQVRSLTLDKWDHESVMLMSSIGNGMPAPHSHLGRMRIEHQTCGKGHGSWCDGQTDAAR
jgi:hypothetical protein